MCDQVPDQFQSRRYPHDGALPERLEAVLAEILIRVELVREEADQLSHDGEQERYQWPLLWRYIACGCRRCRCVSPLAEEGDTGQAAVHGHGADVKSGDG